MKKTQNKHTQKVVLSLTASILAASAAHAYEVPLTFMGTNMPPLDFHGFLSQGFLDSSKYNYLGDTTRGSFNYTEAGVNVSMDPFPHTHITAQGFLFDVGRVGQYDPTLDYALVDYNFSDAIGVRAGRIIRPEGIYNSIQSIDLARTSIILPQGMYDARWRDFSASIDGGSLYGDIGLHKGGDVSYEVYGGMANLAPNGGIARLLEDSLRNPPTQYLDVNGFPEAGIQLWWNTPVQGLRAGVFALYAFGVSYDYKLNIPPAFGGGGYHSVLNVPEEQFSLEYQWKSWTFQAEYRYEDLYSHNVINGITTTPTTHTAEDTWYVSAAYQANHWLQVGAYYTEDYANVANRTGDGTAVPSDAYQKDFALSFRFDPKPWWVIKLEGHAINGTALIADGQNNPNRNGREWYMLALKTTVSF